MNFTANITSNDTANSYDVGFCNVESWSCLACSLVLCGQISIVLYASIIKDSTGRGCSPDGIIKNYPQWVLFSVCTTLPSAYLLSQYERQSKQDQGILPYINIALIALTTYSAVHIINLKAPQVRACLSNRIFNRNAPRREHVPATPFSSQFEVWRTAQQSSLELRTTFARNPRETAMAALSEDERIIYSKLIRKYNATLMTMGGVDAVLHDFQRYATEKYQAAPVIFAFETHNKKLALPLPMTWNELQDFYSTHNVPKHNHKQAQIAYHKNVFHSAYRFFLIPNPWMDPAAQYVIRMEDHSLHADYSTHKQLIAYCWLACSDPDEPIIYETDMDARQEFFTKSIADLNRTYDSETGFFTRGTDNFQRGDMPSCSSGTPKRFYQTVLNHSLFQGLNYSILDVLLRQYVLKYYRDLFANMSCIDLKKTYDALHGATGYFVTLSNPPTNLVFPTNQQQDFLTSLNNEFPDTAGIDLQQFVHEEFDATLYANNHFLKYYKRFDLQRVLQTAYEKSATAATRPSLQFTLT